MLKNGQSVANPLQYPTFGLPGRQHVIFQSPSVDGTCLAGGDAHDVELVNTYL